MGEPKTGPRGEAWTQAPRTIQIGVRGRHHEGPRPYCPMDSLLSLDGHAQVSDARRNGQIALLHLLGARVDVRTIWVHIIISSARRQEQRQRRAAAAASAASAAYGWWCRKNAAAAWDLSMWSL